MFSHVNGVEMNINHPQTFEVPTLIEKNLVKIGDFVKIGFYMTKVPELVERMWLEVVRVNNDGTYEGALVNNPVVMPVNHLCYGEVIKFESKSILNIEKA